MKKIRIGTRGSRLALWQASFIEAELKREHPDIPLERIIIKTEGDRDQTSSLTIIGGQGVFTKALETALREDQIDIAVHSLKDLPTKMHPELSLGAVPLRGPVEDVLVTANGYSLSDFPAGSTVATGSIRRRSQLMSLRPDLLFKDLRGNIETRLKKLLNSNLDAILMARAALVRLELDQIPYYTLKIDEMIPGVGQGAIGIQIRGADTDISSLVQPLNHLPSYQAVIAERAFLRELDSDCQFPVGCYATVQDGQVVITGYVGSPDGKSVFRDQIADDNNESAALGRELAGRLVKLGADKLLEQFRNKSSS
jgi:hydroxymethylbilane synthase